MASIPFRGLQQLCELVIRELELPLVAMASIPFRGLQPVADAIAHAIAGAGYRRNGLNPLQGIATGTRPGLAWHVDQVIVAMASIPFRGLQQLVPNELRKPVVRVAMASIPFRGLQLVG